jgi:PAS domain S-box-containing protein/putative nucleotidyltransferase with HDIG domain
MSGDQLASGRRISREELRAELERAHEQIGELEAERKRSQERLIDGLAQHLLDGLALLDPDGVHLDVNPAFCALVGFSREELIGHGLPHPYWPPEEREDIERTLLENLAGTPRRTELTFMRKSGERLQVLITPTVMRDEHGRPICIFATIKDITLQKRAEEALRASEAKYRNLFESAEVGMFRTRLDGSEMLDVNSRFLEIIGRTREEVLEQPSLVFWADPAERAEMARRLEARGRVVDFECHMVRKSGEVRTCLTSLSITREQSILEGSIVDITERKRSEDARIASEARYRALAEASPDMIYVVGSDRRVEYVNEQAAQRLGERAEHLVGTPLGELFKGPTAAKIVAAVERVLTSGDPWEADSLIAYPSGERWVSTRLVALIDDGRVSAVLGVSHDVTERRGAEDALAESERRYHSLFEDSPVAMWEDDYSAVKTYLEGLVASGVEDVERFLREHPAEYEHCVSLSRTRDANRAAVVLFEAASREEAIARQEELYPRGVVGGLPRFWASMLAGKGEASYEEVNRTLSGRELQVFETARVAPGHEGAYDRVYLADVDITDRKRAEVMLREHGQRLGRALDDTVAALGATVAMRDPYTASHERRVSALACRIAERLGWSEEATAVLRNAALVHDVGKIAIPAEILSKPTRLSETEFELIKSHSALAYEILAPIEFEGPVAEVVYQHHERLDGSGYPRGLRGTDILPAARVLAVADVVEAMISHRPYRPALTLEEALAEIGANSRGRFDAEAAEACRRLFEEEGFAPPE